MADSIKHFVQRTSLTLCSVLYLFIHKSSSLFHTEKSCGRPKFDTSAAQKKQKQKTKKTKKNAFRSGLLICHKLWDTEFFSFSLMRIDLTWQWNQNLVNRGHSVQENSPQNQIAKIGH